MTVPIRRQSAKRCPTRDLGPCQGASRLPTVTAMRLEELQHAVRGAIEDPALTYRQRVQLLASLAENVLDPPPLSAAAQHALDKRVICDMYEGNAPYRPRYVLPDYAKALRQGSAFLELPPPAGLEEAIAFLLAMYANVPSITGYPVYLGNFDELLASYVGDVDDDTLYRVVRNLWVVLDRTMPDAFTHTNIGPEDSRVTRAVLRVAAELRQVVPNLTLRVDPERTPDDLVLEAVRTVFACGGPHFVNHPMMTGDLGDRYGVVSCYNSLLVGGGAHSLVRLNLKEVVLRTDGGVAAFLDETLPEYVALAGELAASRIRHLVEQARFYEHSWLVGEGLVDPTRFTAMFGVVGLAEAVDLLQEREGRAGTYGHDDEANALAQRVVEHVARLVAEHELPHCEATGGRALLHSQAGLDSDDGFTAGTRIPVGTEPPLLQHLLTVAPLHRWFPSGVSDVLAFDETAVRNPQACVDVIRGAFAEGMRDVTFNLDSNDFVRITGYLVRKSDLAKLSEEGARHGSTFLGSGSMQRSRLGDRVAKRVISGESGAGPAR
jgi:YjjI family glycine radical enzyme